MVHACIALLTLVTLAAMSVRANRRFAPEPRLPMQWSVSGSVNWTAPRVLALAFMPVMGAIVLGLTAVANVTLTPRPGQEGLQLPVMLLMSFGLVRLMVCISA